MKSTVETLSPTRVRLSVEVSFEELEPSVRRAYRSISDQVRIPGFRPGKVPPRLIDQRIGRAVVLEEAARNAIPQHYIEAVREHEVKPLGRPAVEITKLQDGEVLEFTVEVDVTPQIELPDLSSVSITVDPVEVAEEEVDEQLRILRERFATLKGVQRPAQIGDYVSIDLVATIDGEEVPGGSATGVSYEVGSGQLLEGLDDTLVGMTANESATFTSTLVGGEYAGQEAQVAVTVRAVREKELPDLDDSFAQLASEFDTLEELRADLRTRRERAKRLEQAFQARDKVLEALLERTEIPVPEGVVQEEVDFRKQSMREQLERIDRSWEEYLESENTTEEQLDQELRESATKALKTQLLLDAIADAEEVGVNDTELTQEVIRRAQAQGAQPREYAERLQRQGQLPMVVADIRRGKALALAVEQATVTDTAGNPVDLSTQSNNADSTKEASEEQSESDSENAD